MKRVLKAVSYCCLFRVPPNRCIAIWAKPGILWYFCTAFFAKDLTIRELANILHMQKTTYHNYEIGKRELPFELAVTLAKFYNVSLDYIGGFTNDPTPANRK